MKILIVGASGLVGSHLLDVFNKGGDVVVGTHLNFPTKKTVFYNPLIESDENFKIEPYHPDVIIHCGALTNVDYCELNPEESEKATVTSTDRIAGYCRSLGAKLIYISTDYVFDGLNGPYTETEKTNPINVYGRHKLRAEEIVGTLNNFLIARITNVYGEEERSKNFIARLLQMYQNQEDKTLHLPIDQFATPVYAGDVARMLHLLIKDNKSGIYNLSSTDYFARYTLAKRVESYFPTNKSVMLKPIDTTTLKQAARRPLFGGLLNIKFISEYPDFTFTNVDDFIKK